MSNKAFVITPDRIVDYDLERVVYSPGDRVPLDDAVKYGLIDGDDERVAGAVELLESVDARDGVKIELELPADPPPADDDEPKRGKRRGGNRAHEAGENR